jgi:hypothetical protein
MFFVQGGTGVKPPPTMPRVPTETAKIISIFPRVAFNNRVGIRQFEMPPCPKCKKHDMAPCRECKQYSELLITAMIEGEDAPFAADGSGRILHVIEAMPAAESLVREGASDRGVFVIDGDAEPTAEQITAAIDQYINWGINLVREADELWGLKKDPKLIDARAHDCARYLGLTREWLAQTHSQEPCKICGKFARVGTILGECGHPSDWARADAAGLINDSLRKLAVTEGWLKEPEVTPKRTLSPEHLAKLAEGRRKAAEAKMGS